MKKPARPANERQRQETLSSLEILDTPPEERFDRLTRIAQRHFRVPIALISLVDADRQWFKSCRGLDASETAREISFCAHAILGDAVFIVPNALEDPRFSDNPLVVGPPGVRFYAGAPLAARNGMNVGTLCIIDHEPRTLSEDDAAMLRDLADCVERELSDAALLDTAAQVVARDSRLRAVLDTVVDGIVTIDAAGIIETFNPAAERLFGYAAHEVVGNNVKQLMPEPYKREHDGYLSAYMRTGEAKIIGIGREVTGLRKDGSEFPMELAVSGMKVEDRRMFTGIVRDITERKRNDRLKAEFVSTVSHELRTPLTSIRGALGLVASGVLGELPEKSARMVELAVSNTQRLINLVNDLLDMEKLQSGAMDFKFAKLPVRAFIEAAVEDNNPYAAEKRIALEIGELVGDAAVLGDADRLNQVMSNLLSNAVKFSPAGGKVTISAVRLDDIVKISVTDKGPGIPEEFHDKIFERFTQADSSDARQKGGTGLGLSISKAIIEKHQGAVGFDSKAGEGSTFYITLPELGADQHLPSPADAGPRQADDGRPRILYVEDDRGVVDFVSSLIGERAEVIAAKTMAEARRKLAEGAFDLIILDILLPDGSGLDLLPLMKAADGSRLPIIVFSVMEVDDETARQVDRALVKSRTSNKKLLSAVEGLLAKSGRTAAERGAG